MLEVDVQQLLQCLHGFPDLIDNKTLDARAGLDHRTSRPRPDGHLEPGRRHPGPLQRAEQDPRRRPRRFDERLVEGWTDADDTTFLLLPTRDALPTTINAALLSGTDSSGEGEGVGSQDSAPYSGGVQNYLRLHEDWLNVTLTYNGALVSLNTPEHVDGALVVGIPQYRPPTRALTYHTDFNDDSKLPPMTPSFVYLRQQMFVR
jgi:hypothetical protein